MAPLFAREGTIVPLATVDEKTMNAAGKRVNGTRDETVTLRVYPNEAGSSLTLYEDDGETVAYQVEHSSILFVFSPDDRAHVVYAQGFKATDYAHDMPLLLKFRAS